MQKRALKYTLFTFVLTLVMMLAAAGLVLSRVPAKWITVDARVTAAFIEPRSDGGPPDWALLVDLEYRVDGLAYNAEKLRVYTNDEREKVAAERENWPAGKRFTAYSNPDHHESVSLYEDGGRQGPAVAAALLTPAFVILLMIFVYRLRTPGPKAGH